MVIAKTGKTVELPIPLKGFAAAYDAPPIDAKTYEMSRKQFFEVLKQWGKGAPAMP
jgi:hypothetical protein